MDYGLIYEKGGDTVVDGAENFDLGQILDCGQCFRWEKTGENSYRGIAFGLEREVSSWGGTLTFHGAALEEFELLWREYFDFTRDYGGVKALLSEEPVMKKAIGYAPGIRVLRQEPWEALITFILSQNNNIPRIKGLVKRLCEQFGEKSGEGYSFPRPEVLAAKNLDDLSPVRAGFRAKYILDAAKKIASGEILLDSLRDAPPEQARESLERIYGVGPKVADCTLLYGLGRVSVVPMDVWIKRALAALYPGGFPSRFAPVAGIAQQYLFHYVRTCPEALNVT